MESILTSDVFFFVTTCAVIIITAIVAFLGYHIYRIVKKVETVADRVVLGFGTFEDFIKGLPFLKGVFKIKRKTKRVRTEK